MEKGIFYNFPLEFFVEFYQTILKKKATIQSEHFLHTRSV